MKANDILLVENLYSNYFEFYQVIKATAKTVTIRRIHSNKRKGTPCPNEFFDEDFDRPKTKRIGDDGSIHWDWTIGRVWDGKPLQNNHPVWGMNYNLY